MEEQRHVGGGAEADSDAIDIGDFVLAATGARVRRLTMPDGTHWFPAVDAAGQLGYVNTRQAVLVHVAAARQRVLGELVREVRGDEVARVLAGSGLRKSMKMLDLQGLVQLVIAGTKPACTPFKAWVSEVVACIQRDGSYGLEPSTAHWGYVMPPQLVDIVVRAETDAGFHHVPVQRSRHAVSPQELLDSWQADHRAVTGDVRAVAACLAPALVRGGARYRLEEIARRTGLAVERVRDCVGLLVERGCVRESAVSADGARIYLLP
ncbi:Bro-N domain-containing protein [Streptomyces sp. NPDC014870]|uniref:BRO-N domain-containing protein n=1 Tax=Streptomyces sp. NPDC014870 TaxID=3364925 RepID=UPI0036FB76EC